ncbi:MAG: DUF721 domain-containing protein [Bacteroidales bacterium]|nr:DUF721 domain-containing protein [Bacteroidales bacterium]
MKYKNEHDMKEVSNLFWKNNQKLHEVYASKRIDWLWSNCMGETIAKYTQKIILQNESLIVYITNPIVKNELLLNRSKIKALLNEKIGSGLIKQIQIL